jgi:hypothetical protein
MAETGVVQVKAADAYQHSFGVLKGGTAYYNPWKNIDMRPMLKDKYEVGFKALSTTAGGAGTAGYAMIPIYIDPRIVDTTRKFTPLVELIPRVTNMGMTADFNKITAKGGAVVAAEDAALTEANDTYDRVSVPIKFLYAIGRTTGPMQAAMPSYILEGFQPSGAGLSGSSFEPSGVPNALQLEVVMKAREMRELEENLILNGSISSDPNEFNGIIVQQSTTNVVDLSNTALDYDDIETAIRYAFDDGGRPNLAVCSSSALVDIRKIMIDTFRYGPADMAGAGLPFGVSSAIILQTMVGPVVVVPSMYLSNSGGAKQIFFLDTDWMEMRVLQDMTYEDLAKTNDSKKFMLKIYECLVMKNTAFNSFIDNIA